MMVNLASKHIKLKHYFKPFLNARFLFMSILYTLVYTSEIYVQYIFQCTWHMCLRQYIKAFSVSTYTYNHPLNRLTGLLYTISKNRNNKYMNFKNV